MVKQVRTYTYTHTPGDLRTFRGALPVPGSASPSAACRLPLSRRRKRPPAATIPPRKGRRISDAPAQAGACAGGHVGGARGRTVALILACATFWFGLLEGHKVYELRRQKKEIPPGGLRVLLVCNRATRRRWGLSRCMAESRCVNRLGPFTAEAIIDDPVRRAGVMISDDEIRRLLPPGNKGYLYALESVKKSKAQWAAWSGNGSNGNGFLTRLDHAGRARWLEK